MVTFAWLNPVVNSQSSEFIWLHLMPLSMKCFLTWLSGHQVLLLLDITQFHGFKYHLYANDFHINISALIPHFCTNCLPIWRYLSVDVQRHLKFNKSKIFIPNIPHPLPPILLLLQCSHCYPWKMVGSNSVAQARNLESKHQTHLLLTLHPVQ